MADSPSHDEPTAGTQEVILKGTGVAAGVVVGTAFTLTSDEDTIVEREIAEEEIPREVARLEDALIATRKQLHSIQQRVSEAIGQDNASIFDAHLLVVDDRSLVEEVIRTLHERKLNVDAVLKLVTEKYAQALMRVDDDYLRERAADVRDVSRRILRNLAGESTEALASLEEPCIIVAHDLAPSDTASLDKDKVIGLATDLGSPTSHTAIMARALEIPAVLGLHDVSTRVSSGDTLLIDGNKGVFIIHPSPEKLSEYGTLAQERQSIQSELANLRERPAETSDGYNVILSANIELPTDVDAVLSHGARGVGLYRTEFLFLSQNSLPNEDEQAKVYSDVASRLEPDPVIIRTLDLGGDKFLSQIRIPEELNPFMGWRAIRFCLAQPEIFKTQLRAILRASVHENVQIMYPMISNVNEVLQANQMLEEAKQELRERGEAFNENIDVGVMIEVPSAALTADLIAPHVNFFSLGTNDLVQYTLAVDRVNERVSDLYQPTHPAIIKLIQTTIDVGHQHGIWTGICGEMAADPLLVPLLVGLGVDELSVSPTAVPMVKDVIRNLRYSQAEDLAGRIDRFSDSDDLRSQCRGLIEEIAPEILELV